MSAEEQRQIGERVRQSIRSRLRPHTQESVAREIGMTPDALSRSLNGTRAFSSLEIARAADLTGTDVHWLITGQPDPLRVSFAARHAFDRDARQHHLPGGEGDIQTLDTVALAYRQAQMWLRPRAAGAIDVPSGPDRLRDALGAGFVVPFADRVEDRLGVDVMRVPGLSTDYSFRIAGRPVILLKSEPNWFRSNWSLAHELAHLALGHHDVSGSEASEPVANAFAAKLLMPESQMREIDWSSVSPAELALNIWKLGVSTEALANRLGALLLSVPRHTRKWLGGTTQHLLRHHEAALPAITGTSEAASRTDPITWRMRAAAERRAPTALITAHREGIAEGRLKKSTLAWLLGVEPELLETDEPDLPEPPIEALIDALSG